LRGNSANPSEKQPAEGREAAEQKNISSRRVSPKPKTKKKKKEPKKKKKTPQQNHTKHRGARGGQLSAPISSRKNLPFRKDSSELAKGKGFQIWPKSLAMSRREKPEPCHHEGRGGGRRITYLLSVNAYL